jgi:hypothetical protein
MIIIATTLFALVIFASMTFTVFEVVKDGPGLLTAFMCFIVALTCMALVSFGVNFEKNRAIEAALGGEVEEVICYHPKGCSLLIKAKNGESRWTWAPLEEEATR